MIGQYLLVAVGGALGAVLRYGTNLMVQNKMPGDFPYATLTVNIAGAFVMGLLAGLLLHMTSGAQEFRLFAMVGVLGGYTTFSAFSLDTLQLMERGAYGQAALYIVLSVAGTIAATALGMAITRGIAS